MATDIDSQHMSTTPGIPSLDRLSKPQDGLAANEDEYTLIRPRQRHFDFNEDEPLIDTTAALTLHSKRTERLQKRREKKSGRITAHRETRSLLDLPPEILLEILGFLKPSDLFSLLRLDRSSHAFITQNASTIARDVVNYRYATLSRCFPLPKYLSAVDPSLHPALASGAWQSKLQIHRRYQHIRNADPTVVCSCTTCVLAWNNLCLVLDLAHFQPHFAARQPIPMIKRGDEPAWNMSLTAAHAARVLRAMASLLHYARILEAHLDSTTATLQRQVRAYPVHKRPPVADQPYQMTQEEAASGVDAFLARQGRASFEFPFHRDRYHYVEAYMPNRKWSADEKRWQYLDAGRAHEMDLRYILARFLPDQRP